MFSVVSHGSALRALTFADAFSISGGELLQCVKHSPICVAIIYDFAQHYLSHVSVVDEFSIEDDKPLLVYDYQPSSLREDACAKVKTRFLHAPSRSMSALCSLTRSFSR